MPGKLLVFVPGSIFFPACENTEKKIRVMTLCTLLTHLRLLTTMSSVENKYI